MTRLVVLIVSFAVLALLFAVVEWRWPAMRGQRRLRKGVLTDSAYFLFTPIASKPFTGIVVAVSVLAVSAALGAGLTVEQLRHLDHRDTFLGRQPALLQVVEFLILGDLIGYWSHRADSVEGAVATGATAPSTESACSGAFTPSTTVRPTSIGSLPFASTR